MVVGIQAYNGFSKEKTKLIAKVITDFYDVRTILLNEKTINKKAFINVKSPRYRADSIILFQRKSIPDSLDFIIGLTAKDISTTKYEKGRKMKLPAYKYQDWGVMGLGYCPGNSCVVSTYRIKHKDKNIALIRLKKVAVHEFGHNLGLPHCPDKKCVMTDAVESVATIDNAKLALCKICKTKLN
ncbi:M54 archaelysin family metalloprotease precursor [Flavobacterium limnosediminis JC2902]|uniref:M54 archaelysin family metalloprotease n=1 Tax=Flavobacterium limnosediminis JC2902 TaxID=1341181 RepID=V6SKY4_9FLAO|nr:matrixin family metalloprotease [Flavobacterium limnosediminis]ESU27109.1 M54 archaelysin family metalloprotease precursor [Flavobacterium limnosediminis JC2902]